MYSNLHGISLSARWLAAYNSILPRLTSWNARSLQHHDVAVAAAKVQVVKGLLSNTDVFALQEAHGIEVIKDLLGSFAFCYSPCETNEGAAGGILLAIHQHRHPRDHCQFHVLVPGRLVACIVGKSADVVYISCHLTPDSSRGVSWKGLLTTLHAFVSGLGSSLIVMLGDFNMIVDVDDVVPWKADQDLDLGSVPLLRARLWQSTLPDWSILPSPPSFEHLASSTWRAIDRIALNAPDDVASQLRVQVQTWSSVSPPARSDHWPIVTRAHEVSVSLRMVPRSVVFNPSWKQVFRHAISIFVDETLPWQEKWAQIHHAARHAAWHIQHDLSDGISSPACARKLLRLLATKGLEAFQEAASTHGLPMAVDNPSRVIHDLLSLGSGSSASVAKAEIEAPKSGSDFLRRIWRKWKCLKRSNYNCAVLVPQVPFPTILQQKAVIAEYWRPVFAAKPPMDHSWAKTLLQHAPNFVWPLCSLSVKEVEEVLALLPDTAPGPSGFSNKMLQALQPCELILETWEALISGDKPPWWWRNGHCCFIPKSQSPLLQPSDLRPIALCESVYKVIGRIMYSKLRVLIPGLCECQHGLDAHGSTIEALGRLEKFLLHRCLGRPQSSIFFGDFKSAFSYVKLEWLLFCIHERGAPAEWINLFKSVMSPTSHMVVWGHESHAYLPILDGIVQGEPLSSFMFALAIDPWLRYLHSCSSIPAVINYLDDLTFVLRSLAEYIMIWPWLNVLALVVGLELNVRKCKVIPMGSLSIAQWIILLQDSLPVQHPAIAVSVCEGAKWLGYWITRHLAEPYDQVMVSRMKEAGVLIPQLRLGAASSTRLLHSIVANIARFALMVGSPSLGMRREWECVMSRLHLSLAAIKPFEHSARSLLGLAVDIPQLEIISITNQATLVQRKRAEIQTWSNGLASFDVGELRLSELPFLERLSHAGCWSSWKSTEQFLVREHLLSSAGLRLRRKALYNKLLSAKVPTMRHSRYLLEAALQRAWQGIWDDLPRAHLFAKNLARKLLLIGSRLGPRFSMALLRLTFQFGDVHEHHHGGHVGNCCWCDHGHLAISWKVRLRMGCFRVALSSLHGFSYLQFAPPQIFFELVMQKSDLAMRRLGRLAYILVRAQQFCRFGSCSARSELIEGKAFLYSVAVASLAT